jgi:hypothetical protein
MVTKPINKSIVGRTLTTFRLTPTNVHSKLALKGNESNSAREFHPQALTEPDVNVSIHPACYTNRFEVGRSKPV